MNRNIEDCNYVKKYCGRLVSVGHLSVYLAKTLSVKRLQDVCKKTAGSKNTISQKKSLKLELCNTTSCRTKKSCFTHDTKVGFDPR